MLWHKGILCQPLLLNPEDTDEVTVRWDPVDEQWVVLCHLGDQSMVLHEDDTFRAPHPHALAQAWSTARSMNQRDKIAKNNRKQM